MIERDADGAVVALALLVGGAFGAAGCAPEPCGSLNVCLNGDATVGDAAE